MTHLSRVFRERTMGSQHNFYTKSTLPHEVHFWKEKKKKKKRKKAQISSTHDEQQEWWLPVKMKITMMHQDYVKKQREQTLRWPVFKSKTGERKKKYYLNTPTSVTQSILCLIFFMNLAIIQHLHYSREGPKTKKQLTHLTLNKVFDKSGKRSIISVAYFRR